MSRSVQLEARADVSVSTERVPLPSLRLRPVGAEVRICEIEVGDAELVRRAIEGDRWARAALYHRHARELANLALRLLRRRDEAADVVQDTFVSAFESLRDLREPEKVRSWLRSIAVRHVQRRFRRRRLMRVLGLGGSAAPVPLEELALAEADQETRAELRRADVVLARLPERARLVWTLRLVEGESLPAIAEACDVSLATVKRDLALAQEELRRALDGGKP